VPGGGPAAGWTLYPPLVLQTGESFPLAIFAIHLDGRLLDHGLDQHHRHHHEPARAGHDAAEDAAVLLDVADHRLPADRRDAGVRGRGDDAADGPLLRHHVLRGRAAATRCSTSTSSGSSGTPRSTS
jgi:hypothetical protein